MQMKSIVLDIKNNSVYDGPTTEIAEDMPDFEETTAESPAESEESVIEHTADSENATLSEEKETKTEEKPNLPAGFSFNPIVIAIKPFYDKAIAEDELFADEVKEKESRAEKPKSLAECADYIIGEAYKYAKEHQSNGFGLAGFPDEMMPTLIKHYYDEEDIKIERFDDARVEVGKPIATPTTKKPEKKGKEKPKPPKNVLDIKKAITSSTAKETGKKAKKKDNLLAGFVPMERPDTYEEYAKTAKKGSREQAKSVDTIDMFADFFAEEENKK